MLYKISRILYQISNISYKISNIYQISNILYNISKLQNIYKISHLRNHIRYILGAPLAQFGERQTLDRNSRVRSSRGAQSRHFIPIA